jgi:hypothetical protein
MQSLFLGLPQDVESFLRQVFEDLDPSLFQNIILGILAIFIPFAIVFLTDLLRETKPRNEFEKMVLSSEVLGAYKVFWLSALGMGVLAFFSNDSSILGKLFATVFTIFLIYFLGKSFGKILKFSEGQKEEFEIAFLKGLNLSKIFIFNNKTKAKRIVRAWNSFWAEKSENDETPHTEIFITHIDKLIEARRYLLAVQLSRDYEQNLEKRNRFSVCFKILPKILEWNKIFWIEEQIYIKKRNLNRNEIPRVQKIIRWALKWLRNFTDLHYKFFKWDPIRTEFFPEWDFFAMKFFPAVAKNLMLDQYGPSQLFLQFEKHIDDCEIELDQLTEPDKKQKQWDYIRQLFSSFCPIFFENINSVSTRFDVWKNQFPGDWKIKMANSQKNIPRIILDEFRMWAGNRVFKKRELRDDDKLSEVANGIFPNVDPNLFGLFLALFFSDSVREAIKNEPRFHLTGTGVAWSGEKSDAEISEMLQQRAQTQKQETIDIIFRFFSEWQPLILHIEDLSEEERSSKWEDHSEEKRKLIVDRVRRNNLQKILDELDSLDFIEMCKDSKILEARRTKLIVLVKLLLEHIDN